MNIITESCRGLEFKGAADIMMTSRQLFFSGEVNSENVSALLIDLIALNLENPDEEITLYINSNGGSVKDGLAVYDYLRHMKAPLRTICIGSCASMGSIIFLAGDTREITPNSTVMLHDPSYGASDIGGKKPHEIQKQVDSLMQTREVLASIISERTGRPLEEVYEITKDDSYFSSKEAVSFGLATNIIITTRKENEL